MMFSCKRHNNTMIKNLIFDFGKVLVDYDFEGFFQKYIPDDERRKVFVPILYNEELQCILDRELRPFDEVMEEIIENNKEYESEIRLFCDRYPELITNEIPGMRELLTQLKGEGFKLYGLTNWCNKVYLTMREYEIFNLLDGYVISSDEKFIKPEPEIYRRLFDRFNLLPEECIFTDDKEVNIEGGRRFGMDGIVFRNARQYEQDLREKLKG